MTPWCKSMTCAVRTGLQSQKAVRLFELQPIAAREIRPAARFLSCRVWWQTHSRKSCSGSISMAKFWTLRFNHCMSQTNCYRRTLLEGSYNLRRLFKWPGRSAHHREHDAATAMNARSKQRKLLRVLLAVIRHAELENLLDFSQKFDNGGSVQLDIVKKM